MRSWGFLASRRWALFALTVVVVAWATWWLGEWQFHRLADRKAANAVVAANEARPPAPVSDVLAPGRPVRPEDEWRLVTATGTYDTANTVIVRYQTRDGASGVEVVVPLLPIDPDGATGTPTDGPALLVDRGWLATDNRGLDSVDVPAPPVGQVTVTGWVRADATGDSAQVTDRSTRAVSSVEIGRSLGLQVYGGFVDLRKESPAAATPLVPAELPELNNGPHFFYGLQWWFFGVLAVTGFFYLMYDEWGQRRRGTPGDAGTSVTEDGTANAPTST